MNKKELENYINQHLSISQISKLTNKSKTTIRHWLSKYSLKTIYINTSKLSLDEKRKRNVISVDKRRKKLKILAIEYKGGKCEKCGYDKCKAALEFHHLDPNEKDFGIASKGYTRSWEAVKKELDKCIMVCANCHREIHEEEDNG